MGRGGCHIRKNEPFDAMSWKAKTVEMIYKEQI